MEKNQIEKVFEDFKELLTHDGVARIFEDHSILKPDYLQEESKPEKITIDYIITEILDLANVSGQIGERKFKVIEFDEDEGIDEKTRWVDIKGETEDGRKFLLAAKKLNEDLERDREELDNLVYELYYIDNRNRIESVVKRYKTTNAGD